MRSVDWGGLATSPESPGAPCRLVGRGWEQTLLEPQLSATFRAIQGEGRQGLRERLLAMLGLRLAATAAQHVSYAPRDRHSSQTWMMVGLTQTPGRSFVSFANFVLFDTKYLRVVEVVSLPSRRLGEHSL
jgi:hypothetical protein